MASPKDSYQEFNSFQTAFYTDKTSFENYSKYEIKRHGHTLLYNMSKGFPNLANLILNLRGIGWNGDESPAVLQALQRTKFVNGFNKTRVPSFIYFKSATKEKETTRAKKSKSGLVFNDEIRFRICELMQLDSKSYEVFKFTEDIQNLGKQIMGDFVLVEKSKPTRKKKV